MKLSLRPFKLLLPLLLVYSGEQVFWDFLVASEQDPIINQYRLGLLALGVGAAFWYWRRMEPAVGWGMLLTVVYLLGLMLESYATHGTWLVYMHVFAKVFVLFYTYGMYGYYQRQGLPPLRPLVVVLFIMLIANMLVVHPEALSMKAFLDNERGFSAGSALMFVLPVLLCLNWYLQRGSIVLLGGFFVGLALIVFLQHRSVWITTLVTLPLNLLLVWRRVVGARFSAQRVTLLVVLPLVFALVGGLATVLDNPAVVKRFETSFEDITKADKQGTGSWRLKQMEAYRPLVAQRPLLGWRLEGFEVPMKFYDPASDQPMWPDGTGHHFHSFYMDRIFYFGWLGILLVVVLPCVQIIKRLAFPVPLTAEAAALISFFVGTLVYGLSYYWPDYLYPLLGLMLAATARPTAVAAPPLATPQPAPRLAPEPVLES